MSLQEPLGKTPDEYRTWWEQLFAQYGDTSLAATSVNFENQTDDTLQHPVSICQWYMNIAPEIEALPAPLPELREGWQVPARPARRRGPTLHAVPESESAGGG